LHLNPIVGRLTVPNPGILCNSALNHIISGANAESCPERLEEFEEFNVHMIDVD